MPRCSCKDRPCQAGEKSSHTCPSPSSQDRCQRRVGERGRTGPKTCEWHQSCWIMRADHAARTWSHPVRLRPPTHSTTLSSKSGDEDQDYDNDEEQAQDEDGPLDRLSEGGEITFATNKGDNELGFTPSGRLEFAKKFIDATSTKTSGLQCVSCLKDPTLSYDKKKRRCTPSRSSINTQRETPTPERSISCVVSTSTQLARRRRQLARFAGSLSSPRGSLVMSLPSKSFLGGTDGQGEWPHKSIMSDRHAV